jgi:tetratricopeptide (TPR) repeat protein/DNA-binding MarR family transcriptional regulator
MGAQTYLPIEILDYLETHCPPEDASFGISQRELAKALGYHPCSMSRPLSTLVTDGLLSEKRGLVRDGVRKQLTYRLTDAGLARLRRETREVPLLSGEIPPPPHPFLGRRDELTQLADFSREGRSVVFVDGPPGMGKTALVSRHLRRIKRGRIPFWFAVRPASSPRQFVSALSHALSFLGAQQLAYYSQLPRTPVAREVADLTARALGNRSLAAVFDDVQMASPDMMQFLQAFVETMLRSRTDQFFFVGQESPAFEPANRRFYRLTVGGLDRASAHDLTDRQGGLADRFESVYQSTLGSPLLLQLAVLNPGVEADAANLPNAVVKRLPIEEVRAMLPAAIANEPLPTTFLSDHRDLSQARVNELARMGILHRTLQGRVEVLQVVRSALLGRVGSSDEREAHLSLAQFYARSRRPEAVRERFLHLVEGEAWKNAAQLLSQQERTILRLGYSETLRNALRHLATVLPHGQAKVRVLMIEAALLRHHSDYSEAINSLRRAIAEANDDPKVTCECLLGIADLHIRLRQLEEARKAYEGAQRFGPVSRRVQAYYLLSEARLIEASGDNHAAHQKYQEAFELARKFRVTDLSLESIAAWSRLAELQSGPDVALRVIAEALPEARKAGRMDIAFNLQLVRARAYAETGRESLAESEIKSIRSEAESLGYLNQLTYTLSGLAAMAIEGRRWGEAVGYSKQASALAERLGNDLVLGHTLALLCTTEFREAYFGGSIQLAHESIAHGERSVEILERLPGSDSLVLAHSYLAEVYSYTKDTESARRHYDRAIDLADSLGLAWLKERTIDEVGPKVNAVGLESNDKKLPAVSPNTTSVSPAVGG